MNDNDKEWLEDAVAKGKMKNSQYFDAPDPNRHHRRIMVASIIFVIVFMFVLFVLPGLLWLF